MVALPAAFGNLLPLHVVLNFPGNRRWRAWARDC